MNRNSVVVGVGLLAVAVGLLAVAGVMLRAQVRTDARISQGESRRDIGTASRIIEQLVLPCEVYRMHVGKWPDVPENLTSAGEYSQWNGPYIDGELQPDPWGEPYRFKTVGAALELRSAGPDREPGTADDITRTVQPR